MPFTDRLARGFDLTDVSHEECVLDPYAYQPGIGSRIAGLAVGQTGHDPDYVFHTDYVSAGRGEVYAHIRFRGLRVKTGTLLVRVHLLRQGERPQLVLVTSERIAFNRLAQMGGELTLRFEAFNDCLYAIYGAVVGTTDAEADSLEIVLHKARQAEDSGFHTEARNSDHGRGAGRPQPLLHSTEAPSLHGPVSQIATAEQLRSLPARAILEEAPLPRDASDAERWAIAYTVRCLETYGMTAGGARGLGLCSPSHPIARLLDQRSIAVDCFYDRDGAAVLSDRQAVNYDFLWRVQPKVETSTKKEWARQAEQALHSLLPGGFAIFTFGYDPTVTGSHSPEPDVSPVLNRIDVERLALNLVSRGHEVAQLRIVGGYKPMLDLQAKPPSMAGLVVRRAAIPE